MLNSHENKEFSSSLSVNQDYSRESRSWFIQANHVIRKGIKPLEPEWQNLLGLWMNGVVHGIITSNPQDITYSLQDLGSRVLRNANEMLFIDSHGFFSPERFTRNYNEQLELRPLQTTNTNGFPTGLFYVRPFQSMQFHQILTQSIPQFVREHPRLRVILISELLSMFFMEEEKQYDPSFPRGQIEKLVQGLHCLRQITLQYDIVSFIVLHQDFLRLPTVEHNLPVNKKRMKPRFLRRPWKLLPVPSFFQVMVRWEKNHEYESLRVLKHFEREDMGSQIQRNVFHDSQSRSLLVPKRMQRSLDSFL